MTYVTAWKTETCVFIVADTALSSSQVPANKQSTFNEKHIMRGKLFVEESMLKINRISNDIVISYAGTVEDALNVIDTIKELIEMGVNISEALEMSLVSSGPFQNIILVIGYFDQGTPVLCSYNYNGNCELLYHQYGEIIQFGSITEVHKKNTQKVITELCNGSNIATDQSILSATVAFLQSIVVHSSLMNFFAGGAFVGVLINDTGIKWQKDTTYIIYNSGDFNITPIIIRLIVREGVLATISFEQQWINVFINHINTPDIELWQQEWKDNIEDELLNFHQDGHVVTFMDKLYPIITQFHNYNTANDYFLLEINHVNDGWETYVGFTKKLKGIMDRKSNIPIISLIEPE